MSNEPLKSCQVEDAADAYAKTVVLSEGDHVEAPKSLAGCRIGSVPQNTLADLTTPDGSEDVELSSWSTWESAQREREVLLRIVAEAFRAGEKYSGTLLAGDKKSSLDMAERLYNTVQYLRDDQKEPYGDIIERNLNNLMKEAKELLIGQGEGG